MGASGFSEKKGQSAARPGRSHRSLTTRGAGWEGQEKKWAEVEEGAVARTGGMVAAEQERYISSNKNTEHMLSF